MLEYDSFMDETQPFQIGLLLDNHTDKQKEHYEMMVGVVMVGYLKANGKKVELFEKKQDKKSNRDAVTPEQKADVFADLENIFGR